MNRKTRLMIAAIVTLVLAVTATTVWAGSNTKKGSLDNKVHFARGKCNRGLVNMRDATFTMTTFDGKVICSFTVTRTKVPNSFMNHPPFGSEFRSDGFIVEGGPDDGIGLLEACFAYSPLDKASDAQIYVAFKTERAILPSVKQGTPTMLCAATPILNGTFALIGN